ncbi:EamA family transporter RarD [Salidesulfovibrio brasiliensis]
MHRDTASGLASALAAFTGWGLLPIYWKAVQTVSPFETICHRIIWSMVFVALIITVQKRWHETLSPLRSLKTFGVCCLTGCLIGCNWLLYIWAVTANHILETSLGYYMTPLMNVLLGFLFLRERLRPLQVLAVAIAAGGVLWSVLGYGELPWIGLTLAVSFGFYGLLRKTAAMASIPGLFVETAVLTPVAVIVLASFEFQGTAAFLHTGWRIDLLLLGAGAATSLPLMGFANGARKLNLTTLGILQYLAPSLAFLVGAFIYNEPLTTDTMITFGCIWTALVIYTAESVHRLRRVQRIAKGQGAT